MNDGPIDGAPIFEDGAFRDDATKRTFLLRLKVLQENLSNENFFSPGALNLSAAYLNEVRLEEFSAFALHCGWTVPVEMQRLAREKGPVATSESSLLTESKTSRTEVPILKAQAQDKAIIEMLNLVGESPLSLPKSSPGKPGIKAKIKKLAMEDKKLFTSKSFDKSWERLRKERQIAESK